MDDDGKQVLDINSRSCRLGSLASFFCCSYNGIDNFEFKDSRDGRLLTVLKREPNDKEKAKSSKESKFVWHIEYPPDIKWKVKVNRDHKALIMCSVAWIDVVVFSGFGKPNH